MANNSIFNQLNRDSYDKIAENFSFSRAYIWPDLIVFRDYIKDGDKVLDLGCGNGRMIGLFQSARPGIVIPSVAPHLAGRSRGISYSLNKRSLDFARDDSLKQGSAPAVNYFGVDSSEKLIGVARKKYPNKEFQVMDALDLDLLEKTFDVVLSVSVLNHFAKKDHQRFAENVKKVLRPGGYLLMSNWNMWNVKNKKSIWRNVKKKTLQFIAPLLTQDGNWKDVMTIWKAGGVEAPLYYYAFIKGEVKRLLTKNRFEIVKNYYSRKGKKSNLFFGENIITIARNAEF